MKIKLMKKDYFTTKGSSVIKMIQNNNTPNLDLLVREAVQNSLDAAIDDADEVIVNFNVGEFDAQKLSYYFEDISDEIIEKSNDENNKFISIGDTNTCGLIGNLNGKFNVGEKNQNLGKLVFSIMEAQDQQGAGGSWGIGKTVYYRIGEGLVIYYSRILNEDNEYEERMAAAVVENEERKDGFLSSLKGNAGVAFFGEGQEECFRVLTDVDEIHDILDVFCIEPYSNDETGTIVIIPFVNSDELLNDNLNDDERKSWWETEIEEYIPLAIQRWYFPRMARKYCYGPNLVAYVNNVLVKPDMNSPFFEKMTELYNAAYSNDVPSWITKVPILRERNVKNKEMGWFCYGELTNNDLNMISAGLPDPYKYALLDYDDEAKNVPIIALTRRPGMIVKYVNDGRITGNVSTNKDVYVIGVFTLNSENSLTAPIVINLDEYVRRSERADHTDWADYTLKSGTKKVLLILDIYKKIESTLKEKFGAKRTMEGTTSLARNLAKKIGSLLLPDSGFGTGAGTKPGNSGGGGSSRIKKIFDLKFIDQSFKNEKIILHYKIKMRPSKEKYRILNCVETINGAISPSDWEKSGMKYPCNIEGIGYSITSFDMSNVKSDKKLLVTKERKETSEIPGYDVKIDFLTFKTGECYGFDIYYSDETVAKEIEMDIDIIITTNDKMMSYKITSEKVCPEKVKEKQNE